MGIKINEGRIKIEPLILVVEDNADILGYIESVLERNEWKVITAKNGKDALKKLERVEELPDLIVSDIMMPEMDGYDFFKALSEDPTYCDIQFIFLTALDSPEDIRLGKLLGADDYLTKPFDEEDLLATIMGRFQRNKRNEKMNNQIKKRFLKYKDSFKTNLTKEDRKKIILIHVEWDDKLGPKLINFYPQDIDESYPIEEISRQLYGAATTIYGQEKISKSESIHAKIENFQLESYIFFDSCYDDTFRGGEKNYMLAVIAPKISYFHSLKIKNILQEISNKFKEKTSWEIEEYWNKIYNILTHTLTL
ncbi:MAG: response regulator [Promethearchaeia archaeon]